MTARCRYLDRFGGQCTGQPADPNGEILLCLRHLGRAIDLLGDHGYTVLPPESSRKRVQV